MRKALRLLYKILLDQTGAVYYGKKGVLRVYESTRGRDLSISAPMEIRVENEVSTVFTDITTLMINASVSGAGGSMSPGPAVMQLAGRIPVFPALPGGVRPLDGALSVVGRGALRLAPDISVATICATSTDHVYVGQLFPFTKIDIDLASPASADGGLLVVEFWNGTTWLAVTNLLDGTKVGGNSLLQDGKIQWKLPTTWVVNDPAARGTNLYYIRFRLTSTTATDAIAALVEPSSGQFFEVAFVNMNLTAPEGSPRPQEIIKLNRARLDAAAGYIEGPDDVIMEPQPISFTCTIDDLVNRTALRLALACDNPGIPTWPKMGISTKTDSSRPNGLFGVFIRTPPFVDPTKKTVAVQAGWEQLATNIFRDYNEVYFDLQAITLTEAIDGVNLDVRGAIYGAIGSALRQFGYEL